MTRDDIIKLAQTAGFYFHDAGYAPVLHTVSGEYSEHCFIRLAALIADRLNLPRWIGVDNRLPAEHIEVIVRFTDGSIGTGWAAYWHGACTDFAEWCHPDPDEERVVEAWMDTSVLADLATVG